MELICDIAADLDTLVDRVRVTSVVGRSCWFTADGLRYTCNIKGRRIERLAKNSIRRDFAEAA